MHVKNQSIQVATEPRLLDQVREAIRTRHYSIRTEESYVQWIRRFILFHGNGNMFFHHQSFRSIRSPA